VFEGIQCYVYPNPTSKTLPIYRYYNGGNGDHFYTTDFNELGGGKSGYNLENIACYVLTNEN